MTQSAGALDHEIADLTCRRLSDYAQRLTNFAPMPGGVIVIADRNGVSAQRAFGRADLERDLPTSNDHLFEIGSISKVFTSLLVNQLVDDGVLSLDEPITDVLDWVDLGSDHPPVTVSQLLSHTAGLVVGADSVPDELAQLWSLRQRANNREPAGLFHYSNVGFMLLGQAVSTRTKTSFPELVTRRLLEPMGMSGSAARITHDIRPSMAVGYAPARDDRPWGPGDPLAPAVWFETATGDGNIAAPGADMARLVMLLLNRGAVDGVDVVTPQAVARMATPTAHGGEPTERFPGLSPVEESTYGLGINVERVGANTLVTHGGGMVGYSTFFLVDLTAGFGVVVLTNANGDNLYSQMLARAGHADLTQRITGAPSPELPDPDPRVRTSGEPEPGVRVGRFRRVGAPADAPALSISSETGGEVIVGLSGETGRLCRTLTGRYVTDHPHLRRFHLDLDETAEQPRWTHGSDVYVSIDDAPVVVAELAQREASAPAEWDAIVGHYRSYSPWYPTLRIVHRSGRLLLVAPGGVEAPSEEEELVEIAPGQFRIGVDPTMPERLIVGPIVDGQAITLVRDGCVYSRTFTA